MAVRKLKPTTPGQRHKIIGAFDTITASAPEKSLVVGVRKSGGRNNEGHLTMRYIGGGHKRKYRLIDFKRNKDGVPATVKTIEYDPNRSARIALLFYADGEKRYIIAPNGLEVGATLMSGENAAPEVGNALPLKNIPIGTVIHNSTDRYVFQRQCISAEKHTYRYCYSQHRVTSGTRSLFGSFGRYIRSVDFERRRLCNYQITFWRNQKDPRNL